MRIHEVEQNSTAWHQLREGKPTASMASSIITPTGKLSASIEPYAQKLALEIIKEELDNPFGGSKWTDRGHALEAEAAARYEWDCDADTSLVGFVTDDEETMGASPDRLVGEEGILEIKCFTDVEHLKEYEECNGSNEFPKNRKPQAQFQLLVTGREWCDLFLYHPELKPLCIRTTPDLEFQETLKQGIEQVLQRRDEIIAGQR